MIKNIKWLLLGSLSFVACNNDDESTETPVEAGSANFSKYVALGDSFAAGFSDGALFKKGQQGAYPNILAEQFKQVGGGEFTTPFCGDDNLGGLLLNGTPIQGTRMYFNGKVPVSLPGMPVTEVLNHLTGTYSNLGVPGAKSYHLLAAGYGNPAGVPAGLANPYFARFASSASTSLIADALTQQPTFFSLWIGGNDILSYATSGGIGVDQTGNPNPATYGPNDITDPAAFNAVYNGLIGQLTAGDKKGVVANLPYINTLPYFTTIPLKPIPPYNYFVNGDEDNAVPVVSPQDIATINALNAQLYGPLKQALTAFGAGDRIELLSTSATNAVLLKDESLTDLSVQLTAAFTPTLGAANAAFYGQVFGRARQSKAGDYILLPTKNVLGKAPTAANSGLGFAPPAPLNSFGITYPLQDTHVLIPAEVNSIKVATDAYNVTIKTAADSKGLAFVDAKAVMDQLVAGGVVANGYTFTSTFVTGGTFSLDGIHPSPRGYALIANKFLEAINAKYGSTFKGVNVGTYRVLYPASF